MTCRHLFTSTALVAASLQAACMANPPAPSCSVEGAKHFAPTAEPREICERFQRDFHAALGDEGGAGNYSVALSVSSQGTISAQLTALGGDTNMTFPQVAVDVMDRELDYRDLTQLAGAAARLVTKDQSSD